MADFKRPGSSAPVSGESWTATEPPILENFDVTDRLYIVREDDSLSTIARKFYGTASARRRIIEANRSLIHDPYLIEPGWRLRIPA